MPRIVTPDRVTLPTLQRMRDDFTTAGDEVGHYAIDYLIMNYLGMDESGHRPTYVEPLMAACARDLGAEEVL